MRSNVVSVKHFDTCETLRPKRKYIKHVGKRVCSKCGGPRLGQSRYCNPCHAAYMREWRKSHPLTPEQKFKDNARSYANVYKRRGKIHPCPCEHCGSPRSQMHHENYNNPLDVVWLCRPCHLALHKAAKAKRQQKKLREIARHGVAFTARN